MLIDTVSVYFEMGARVCSTTPCTCEYLFQEFDNDAETLVSCLSLNYDDEDIDTGLCSHNTSSTVSCLLRNYCLKIFTGARVRRS